MQYVILIFQPLNSTVQQRSAVESRPSPFQNFPRKFGLIVNIPPEVPLWSKSFPAE